MTTNYADIHKDIIESCKKGNSKAQYKLYSLYSKAMFNICYRMMNNREESEDILQEIFSEVFTRLNTFRYESSFGAWIKRITVNRCINAIKKRKTYLVLDENIQKYDGVDNENVDFEDIKLNVQKVHRAMSKLADGYRVIFSLYLLEGYDHAEIAEILNITESTSKSQYMRAKKKIKEILMTEYN